MFATFILVALFIMPILATPIQSNQLQIRKRIAYGEKAKWHSFPYIVSLREREQIDGREFFTHFCGGALISAQLVLSARHCFWGENSKYLFDFQDIRIVIGATYVYGDGYSYKVSHTIVHSDFDYEKSINDLIIIEIDTPVKFSEIVQPIAISKEWIAPGEVAVFCGFGSIVTGQLNKNKLFI